MFFVSSALLAVFFVVMGTTNVTSGPNLIMICHQGANGPENELVIGQTGADQHIANHSGDHYGSCDE